jgi:hypothetical protein
MATAPIVADPQTRVEHTINPFRAAWLRFEPPVLVVQMAFAIALTMTRNWNAWEGGRAEQVTDDATVGALVGLCVMAARRADWRRGGPRSTQFCY